MKSLRRRVERLEADWNFGRAGIGPEEVAIIVGARAHIADREDAEAAISAAGLDPRVAIRDQVLVAGDETGSTFLLGLWLCAGIDGWVIRKMRKAKGREPHEAVRDLARDGDEPAVLRLKRAVDLYSGTVRVFN